MAVEGASITEARRGGDAANVDADALPFKVEELPPPGRGARSYVQMKPLAPSVYRHSRSSSSTMLTMAPPFLATPTGPDGPNAAYARPIRAPAPRDDRHDQAGRGGGVVDPAALAPARRDIATVGGGRFEGAEREGREHPLAALQNRPAASPPV